MGINHCRKLNGSISNINKYIQKLSVIDSRKGILNICSRITQDFEVSFFSCGFDYTVDFRHTKYLLLSDCDSSWVKEYSDSMYQRIDPRIRECAITGLPVVWNIDNSYLYNLSKEQIIMMSKAYEYGIRSGVTIPFYSPVCISGVFSLVLNADLHLGGRSLKHLQSVKPYISYLGSYINQAIIRILNFESNHQKDLLTPREKDCLCWLADGKTACETASNLFISESTVKFHCKNSMRKLGANNTSQALAIAILRGYIRPVLGNS